MAERAKRAVMRIECHRTDIGAYEVRLTLVAQMRSDEASAAAPPGTVTYEELLVLEKIVREWQSPADTSQGAFHPPRRSVVGRKGFALGKPRVRSKVQPRPL